MAMYGIKTPSHVEAPEFDANLEDRGVANHEWMGTKAK